MTAGKPPPLSSALHTPSVIQAIKARCHGPRALCALLPSRSSADALPLSGTQHYLDAQTAEELRNYSLPEIVAAVRR